MLPLYAIWKLKSTSFVKYRLTKIVFAGIATALEPCKITIKDIQNAVCTMQSCDLSSPNTCALRINLCVSVLENKYCKIYKDQQII